MYLMSRRTFVQQASVGLTLPFGLSAWPFAENAPQKNVGVKQVSTTFEREPLATPYGFKGGYMTDVWQTVVRLQSTSGRHSIGLGTQNVLWSDARVFMNHSESGGNALMYAITERAAQLLKGQTFTSPIEMQEQLLDELISYGKQITKNPQLRTTFVLNALVALDNAAWLLHAAENGIDQFDAMIPQPYRAALGYRHPKVVSVSVVFVCHARVADGATGPRRLLLYEDQTGAPRRAARDDRGRQSQAHRHSSGHRAGQHIVHRRPARFPTTLI